MKEKIIMISKTIAFLMMLGIMYGSCIRGNEPDSVANYKIKAKLLPDQKMVEGYEILHWRNISNDKVNNLCLHLYMNAFKNESTIFMEEAKNSSRDYDIKEGEWGYIDIRSIRMADGRSLMKRITIDDTIMRVDLYEPIEPGKELFLEITFNTKLPRIIARAGYFGEFYFVSQWFPKIAVYSNSEWNCHYYHANSEFFSDFGQYSIDISVPQEYIVAATGNLTGKKKDTGNTLTYTYNAENVHDFAWSASPNFEMITDTYDGIEIQLFIQKSHSRIKNYYLNALKGSLKYFGEWYGKYPYSKITIVEPPFGAAAAGGMEYPTLFTGGSDIFFNKFTKIIELITVHEFGHQYWYGLVASNEFEEAWLDEGITSYSTAKVLEALFTPENSGIDIMGMKLSAMDWEKATYLSSLREDPIFNKSWEYIDSSSYTANVYAKSALFIATIENMIGSDKMSQILRTYFTRYIFKHPRTADFENVVKEIAGEKLNDFMKEVIYGTGTIDYAVVSLDSELITLKKGIFDTEKGKTEITDKQVEENPDKKKKYNSEIVVKRLGEIVVPVEIEFIFDDGKKITKNWDGKKRWNKFKFSGENKIKCAIIDPQNKIVLDVNTTNNSHCVNQNKEFILKYTSRVGAFSQYILVKLLSLL